MKYKLLIIISLFLLTACQNSNESAGQSGLIHDDDVLLVLVDGEPISLPMLESVMEARGISEDDEEAMRGVLEELIRMQAVANAAEASGMSEEPRMRAMRQLRNLEVIWANYLDRLAQNDPVTEEEVRQVYAAQAEQTGGQQYQVETVVYVDQPTILTDLARLERGEASYEELLAESRSAGRVIDQPLWVDLSQLPPEIATLLSEAAPGDVLSVPLQTPQGWRLVHLTDVRDFEPPPLESVREGIVQTIRRQRMNDHVEALYDAAEITPMLPMEAADEADAEAESD
jgi:parvulin-like peptidyl-prolyl isomerase